ANDKVNSGPEYEGKRVLAGSVIPFVLINGFEAPAGEAASEFPTSATVRLTGPAIGPNGYSVDLTGCLITNLVRGDAATERAKLRPDRLTCKYSYGEVDVAVQGFASGHDGSAGIRGRLVNNKRDKILTYGTLTGGLAGLGQAFGGNGASRQVSLGGAYELPETRDVAIGASTSAVSNAADFLTEYYRNKLQEYYDVIEVKPLVTGTIHIMTTFKMKLIDEERAKGRTNDNV
ncbi:MAG: TraB/VirB10 family protein, partial [Pseudomonadota bacterium]|nr:TraB/VirB10 family protein [Pseudomonadota bacterium]